MTPRRASTGAITSGSVASRSMPSSNPTSSPERGKSSASPPTGCTRLPRTSIAVRSTCPLRSRLPDRLANRQDDVSCFLSLLDVPRRLDHVLQRVPPIDDWAVFPGLDELFKEEDVLLCLLRRYLKQHLLPSEPWGHERPHEVRQPVRWQENTVRLQRAAAPPE